MMRYIVAAMMAMMAMMLGAVPAYAQEKPYPIKGAGNSSCAAYVDAYEAYRPFIGKEGATSTPAYANYAKFEEWLQGFMFGVISGTSFSIKDYNPRVMRYWVYRFCQENPTDIVANAGMVFYLNLGGNLPDLFSGDTP